MKNAQRILPPKPLLSRVGAVRKTRDAVGRVLMRRATGQFYETVVVVWLTLSVASVVLAAANWVQLSRQLNAAGRAVALRLQADSIVELLLESQANQRAFRVTHDARFLQGLRADATNLPVQFQRLADLSKDDSALLQQVAQSRRRAEAGMTRQLQAALAVQTGSTAPSSLAESDASDNDDLLRARQEVAALAATPSALVFNQGAGARVQLTRASLTSLAAGILGLGAGVFAFLLSRLTVQHQERERELIEAKFEADRRSEEKSAFLANMSHEIRTPMNAILGFGELLENEVRDEKQRDYLQSIRRSASSLLQLINDTLDMSKIEAGVLELRPEPTDPREICRFVQTVFTEPAARKGLRLSWRVADDLPGSLLLDQARLRQILVNLVGNAVKFTDQGGIETRIQWQRHETANHVALLIEVADTGVGIPLNRQEAIFQPFVQAGAHREKEHQGAGLGLAIVKRLTEMMGGCITVSSRIGCGTLFSLRFAEMPICSSQPAPELQRPAAQAHFNDLQPATVLGVDDNETNCHLLQAMFAGTHHRLFLARGGREAVELAQKIHPDIILLDVRMPKMDGHQTLEALREVSDLTLIPVIAVTASTLIDEENELRTKFNGYIRKPFSQRDLFHEMARFLSLLPMSAAAAGKEEISPLASAPVSGEVLAEVQQLMDTEWPSIRDSLAINESKAFASKIDGLGQRWQCQPLIAYARTLRRHAESYAVVDLENTLLQFSTVAVELRRQAAS